MSAAFHKTLLWHRFECVGGPFDGMTVTVWRKARTVIIRDLRGRIARYIDDTLTQGLIVASKEAIGRETMAHCSRKIQFAGHVTRAQYHSAKKLAKRQVEDRL